MVDTPSSLLQEFRQQAEEMRFIVDHFVESECKVFKPCSSNEYESIFVQ